MPDAKIARLLFGLLVLGGCQGTIDGPTSGSASGPGGPNSSTPDPGASGGPLVGDVVNELCAQSGSTLTVGRSLLRRITRVQYDNTVRDLLNVSGSPASALSADEKMGPFYSNGQVPITDLIVTQHREVAEGIVASVLPRMNEIAGCDLALAADDSCTIQFVEGFGARAFRRPLNQAERDRYVALYNLGKSQVDAQTGFQMVVETMLQSPVFLYHSDVGASGIPTATPTPLTGYELASRLSYFLWNSMPDSALFQRAASGELLDLAVLRSEVTRMLSDLRAADAIPAFHLQWLGIDGIDGVQKDPALFPSFGPELAQAMRAETANFTNYVIRSGDGLMSTLFTASFSFVDGPLFGLYGVAEPTGFAPGAQVALDPTQRAGLLTQASFLTAHSHPNQTSPVHRGMLVRENLLCQPLQAPPANVNNVPPSPTPTTSTRDRFAQHSADPSCGGCHSLMDPIGLGFEHYDSIGAYRTMDGNQPVDASGEIKTAQPDVTGTFNGAVELSQKLAGSREVAQCMANQWFRFALGRIESKDDACTLKAIYDGFEASGGNVRDLLTALVLSDAFRHVRAVGSTGGM
jgi:Protein of unknown function (DUF1592)/Protein of unknown function (DUF1588)/Protein of unknown function (DUF1585)/Protein of unknown function (DUF1595)/Protein of unknown function (DUF1587)